MSDLRALSDRALLELVFRNMNAGFERVTTELDNMKSSIASLTAESGRAAASSERTAGKVDALITDLRELGTSVRGQFTIARDRIQVLEEAQANGKKRVASLSR